MYAAFHVYKLHVDPELIAASLDRSFKYVSDVQFASQLLNVNGFAFETERCVARNHERANDARQVRGQALGHPIHEVVLLGIATDVCERQHHYGKTGCQGSCAFALLAGVKPILDEGKSAYRTVDVLQPLIT